MLESMGCSLMFDATVLVMIYSFDVSRLASAIPGMGNFDKLRNEGHI